MGSDALVVCRGRRRARAGGPGPRPHRRPRAALEPLPARQRDQRGQRRRPVGAVAVSTVTARGGRRRDRGLAVDRRSVRSHPAAHASSRPATTARSSCSMRRSRRPDPPDSSRGRRTGRAASRTERRSRRRDRAARSRSACTSTSGPAPSPSMPGSASTSGASARVGPPTWPSSRPAARRRRGRLRRHRRRRPGRRARAGRRRLGRRRGRSVERQRRRGDGGRAGRRGGGHQHPLSPALDASTVARCTT